MTEFRNTPPRIPIQERPSPELLEDLCVALRYVAVREGYLSGDAADEPSIQEAVSIATELDRRHVAVSERLQTLTRETGWLMNDLLDDCREFPAVTPRVRELDGIRRYLRCGYCKLAEHPEDDTHWRAGDACLQDFIQSFESLEPKSGTVLFRTYNSEWRCKHGDEDTVLLGVIYEEVFLGPGQCQQCLELELATRGAS
jgi:hypothetical protein